MLAIAKAIDENDELDVVLKSSVIKTEMKKAALEKIFPGLNPLSSGMFDLLMSNKRIGILGTVAHKFNQLYDQQIGKEKATVITAVPMSGDMEIKVLAKIKDLTDKAVDLENIVDESILGGFILRIGDKQFNASIADQLNKLKREFSIN